ncbi:pyridine nucleotide-disulfide oxidoreductase, partial [Candidatus Woesearchaeota archaeon]|nr:pyridine nucleotide-disulfide oxidoreductase [Candidatus Woesearchaeota archaeon]
AKDLIVKIYAKDGIIKGAQIVGYEDVVGRLNLLALAIEKRLKLKDIIDMNSCYNPAVSPVNDPLIMAAEICQKNG